jgi:small subunit ribosomal protein SAe
MRGTLTTPDWDVMVDMFFYREPEEAKENEEAAAEAPAEVADTYNATQLPGAEEGYDAYGYNPSGEPAAAFATGFETATGFEAAAAPVEFAAPTEFGANY